MPATLIAGVLVAIACSGGDEDSSASDGAQDEATARSEDPLRVQPYEYPTGTIPAGKRIAIGAHHICASLGDGQHAIKCWGYNADGRLGYGDTVTQGDEPGEMGNALRLVDAYNPYSQLSRVLDVSSFGNNTCVVVEFSGGDGLLHCWGSNQYGQLGLSVPATSLSAPYNTSFPELHAIEVSVGSNFVCRRSNVGEVRCLGSGPLGYGDDRHRGLAPEDLSNERTVPLGTGLTAKQIAASSVEHACALLNNGQVKCWGRNGAGQLGTGDLLSRGFVPGDLGDQLPPVNLGSGRTAKAIAIASYSSCALLDNNQVKCWGSNQDCSLGNGDPTSRTRGNSPEDMGDNLPAVNFGPGLYATQISSGYNHYCALLNNNRVKCWGANEEGSLGIGDTNPRGDSLNDMGVNLPAVDLGTIDGQAPVVDHVYSGHNSNCVAYHSALSEYKSGVKCWGRNQYGKLGLGDTQNRGDNVDDMGNQLPPVNLGSLAASWIPVPNGEDPVFTPGGTMFAPKPIAAGTYHFCAILGNTSRPPTQWEPGYLKCWGANSQGQLGLGDATDRGRHPGEIEALPFVDLGANSRVREVAAGGYHTCAILSTSDDPNGTGPVKCWGRGTSGALGYGDQTNRGTSPDQMGDNLPIVELGSGRTARHIAIGTRSTCALLDNNTVKCWGLNSSGQLGQGHQENIGDAPGELAALSPVDLGTSAPIQQIVAGALHYCVSLDEGNPNRIKCWGQNLDGQLGLGDTENRGDAGGEMGTSLPYLETRGDHLSAGYYHTCVTNADGLGVKCWGMNAYGQLGLGDKQSRGDQPYEMGTYLPALPFHEWWPPKEVYAGGFSTCAITRYPWDLQLPRLFCFGANNFGQLGRGDKSYVGDQPGEFVPSQEVNLGGQSGLSPSAVAVADYGVCVVLAATGQIKCWGNNMRGQLGLGDIENRGDALGEMGDALPIVPLGLELNTASNPCAGVDDNNACTTDSCDLVMGKITRVTLPNGASCTDKNGCTVADQCVGGQCVGTLDPTCSACAGSTCSEDCPCAVGQGTCSASSGCSAGLVCGTGNGAAFGQAATSNVCWPQSCDADPMSTECRRFPRQCETNADCPAGQLCGASNASRFDNQYAHVCWPAACELDPVAAGCGTLQSPCGKCPCVPSCPTNVSSCDFQGTSVLDGCGGVCTGFCANGQLGCHQDSDCQVHSVCELGKGHLFGGTSSQSVCWPQSCRSAPPETRDCGAPDSACGSVCEECQAECGERQCGLDPKCGKSCGVCASGEFCNGAGLCEEQSTDPILLSTPKNVLPPSEAGALAGTLSVTPSGQAHYAIPLFAPPGVNGMTPQLSLEYQSDFGPGPYGLGWRIGGTSAIRRCPRSYSQGLQGRAEPVRYDDQDQFCLDGVPLVATGSEGDVVTYSTELETFTKVRSFAETIYSGAVGPERFEIEYPDGKVAIYGGSASLWAVGSVTTFLPPEVGAKTTWALSRVRDQYGNATDFGYRLQRNCSDVGEHQKVPGRSDWPEGAWLCGSEPVLSIVYYGHNTATGVSHNRSIEFKYKDLDQASRASLIRSGWDSGEPKRSYFACESITMRYEGSEVRHYQLGYKPFDPVTQESDRWLTLSNVSECFGERCKEATKFSYASPRLFNGSTSVNAGTPKLNDGQRLSLRTIDARLDANGDGLEDLLLNPTSDQRNPLQCSHQWAMAFATGNKETPYNIVNFTMSISTCTPVAAVDFESDGRWEIASGHYIVRYAENGTFMQEWNDAGLLPTEFDDDGDGLPTGVVQTGSRYMNPTLLDTDGDGVFNRIVSRGGEFALSPEDETPDILLGVKPETFTWDEIEADDYARAMKRMSPECTKAEVFGVEGSWEEAWEYNSSAESNFCSSHFGYNPSAFGGGLQAIELNGDNQPDLIEWHPGLGETLTDVTMLQIPASGATFPYIVPAGTTPTTVTSFAKIDIKAFENTGANAFVAKTVPVSIAVWPAGEDTQLTSRAFRQSFAYDTDHDGRQELVVVLSKGSVISIPIRPDLGPGDPGTFIRIIGKVPPPGDYDKFIVSDIDGDGTQDVLFGDETWHVLFQHDQAAADRLKRVTDGMGRIDDVTYEAGRAAPYTPWDFVRDHSRAIKIVPSVVTSHEVLEDTARAPVSVTTERFLYEGARNAFFGRGSLGFARVTRTLEADGTVQLTEVSTYDNDTHYAELGDSLRNIFPFAGRLTSRQRTYPPVPSGIGASAQMVTVREEESWYYGLGYSSLGRPFVYLAFDDIEHREVTTSGGSDRVWVRGREYQVTPYGAVNDTIDSLLDNRPDANLVETSRTTSEYEFTGSDLTAVWPRRLPTKTTTTSTRNGESVTRIVDRDYSPEGGLEYEQDGSGEPSLYKRVEYQRNSRGNVTFTTTQGTSSRVEQTLYDVRGEFAETEINALGHQSTNAWYKGYGILAAHQDPNGLTSQTIIDGFGRTLYSTDSQGNATTTSYWSDEPSLDFLKARTKLIEKRTQAGIDTFTYLDPFARKIGTEVSTQKGYLETAFGYDKLGRMVWTTSRPFIGGTVPASNVTTYTRDAMGRVTQIRYPNDAAAGGFSQVNYAYARPYDWPNPEIGSDLMEQGASMVERRYPGGATELELLDAAGRRSALRDRAGAVSTIRYGAFGLVRQIRDAAGVSLTVSYDALGRQTGTTDPIRGNSSTTYSSGVGETVTVVSQAGTSVREADALGRVTTETRPEGVTLRTYDNGTGAIGQLVSVVGPPSDLSPNGTMSTFAYGPSSGPAGSRGKVISSTQTVAGESFSMGYSYDAYGRPLTVTYPSAAGRPFGTKLGYDRDGNLATVENLNDTTQPKYYEALSRTSLNEIESERLGGKVVTTYGYYPLNGLPRTVTHGLNSNEISATTLQYNETGSVRTVGITENGTPSDAARIFTYDTSDRLTETYRAKLTNGAWAQDAVVQSVSHDSLGKITSKSDLGTYKYELPGNPYAVTSIGSSTYQYDNLGRQTGRTGEQGSSGFTKMVYASHGQPTKVTTTALGEVRYLYNGALERVLSSDAASMTIFLTDLYKRTTNRTDGTRTHVYFVKAQGQTVVEVAITERNNAVVGSPEVRIIRTDHLGSAHLAIDSSNAITRTHYDAFGQPQGQMASSATAFAGYINEPTSGLLRMGVRMYDPKLGVVLTPDAVATDNLGQDSLNPYTYAYNRPTLFRDPTGMTPDFFGASVTSEVGAYLNSWIDAVYPQLPPSVQQAFNVAAAHYGMQSLADQVTAFYYGGNYALLYGDYPFNWLFQTGAGQQALVSAQNACMGVAWVGAAGAGLGMAAGLAGYTTAMGMEIGIPSLTSLVGSGGLAEAVAVSEVAAPMAGKAMQAEGNAMQGVARNANILSGHGGLNVGTYSPVMQVPQGTSITVWASHGSVISDRLGQAIETGKSIGLGAYPEAQGAMTYLSGSYMPNYTLYPPTGLQILGNPTTVSVSTYLSSLVSPYMGNVQFAACPYCAPYP